MSFQNQSNQILYVNPENELKIYFEIFDLRNIFVFANEEYVIG